MFVGWQDLGAVQGTQGEGGGVIRILQGGQRPLQQVLVALSGSPLLPQTSGKRAKRISYM